MCLHRGGAPAMKNILERLGQVRKKNRELFNLGFNLVKLEIIVRYYSVCYNEMQEGLLCLSACLLEKLGINLG